MVELEITEVTQDHVQFTLKNTTVAYANALRRILIAEVPTVAIDLVEIYRNNTVLPDEVLAHRLGLIPIYSTREMRYKSECSCGDRCPECSILFEMDVVHTDEPVRLVTTSDVVCDTVDVKLKQGVLIAKLAKDQGLKIRCTARKGIGRMHSKWSPVSAIGFEYDRENSRRETNYWFEESVEKEWPGVKQAEPRIGERIESIHMRVEVIEGFKPIPIVIKALEILRNKISEIGGDVELSG
jgi:DNA-directed RNA polymerase II subunit RPB3